MGRAAHACVGDPVLDRYRALTQGWMRVEGGKMRIICISLALIWASVAAAQDTWFASYDAMRAELDRMVEARETQALLLRFGGGDEMTEAELNDLDARVDRLYPRPLVNKALVRDVDHNNGFRQEIIAYWERGRYMYVYLLTHARDGGIVSLNMRFNSDFNTLNTLF